MAAPRTKREQKVRALIIRIRETKTNWKVTRLIHDNSLEASRVQQNLLRSVSFHDTKTTKPKVITTKPGDKAENQNHSLTKAREKLQEKRQIDDHGINCSFFSVNPKFDLDDPRNLSRTGRDGKERCDAGVMAAPRKRKHSVSDEEKPEKRQKKTIETFKSKFKEPVDAKAKGITAAKITTSHEVITTKPRDKTAANQNQSLKDLVAKAREKLQEKRQIDDHGRTCIASQRIAARLARDQVVATVAFDDHLTYHRELEQLGCDFIRDQVSCLNMFDLLSRSDYDDESNSVLEKKEMPRSGEDSMRKERDKINNN